MDRPPADYVRRSALLCLGNADRATDPAKRAWWLEEAVLYARRARDEAYPPPRRTMTYTAAAHPLPTVTQPRVRPR